MTHICQKSCFLFSCPFRISCPASSNSSKIFFLTSHITNCQQNLIILIQL